MFSAVEVGKYHHHRQKKKKEKKEKKERKRKEEQGMLFPLSKPLRVCRGRWRCIHTPIDTYKKRIIVKRGQEQDMFFSLFFLFVFLFSYSISLSITIEKDKCRRMCLYPLLQEKRGRKRKARGARER